MPKLCPNITFPHQQDFFPIRSVTKSSTARFSHENLVEKFKIFVQGFVPIRTALGDSKIPSAMSNRLYSKFTNLKNYAITALDVVLKELQIFQQEKLTIISEHCYSSHTQNATRHTWLPIN